MPIDLNFQMPSSHLMEIPDYVTLMQDRLLSVYTQAGMRIKFKQEQYKDYYDKTAKDHTFKIGDIVRVFTPESKKAEVPN